jgi:hypothetical protein
VGVVGPGSPTRRHLTPTLDAPTAPWSGSSVREFVLTIQNSYGILKSYGVEAPGIEPRFVDSEVAGIVKVSASAREGRVALRRLASLLVPESQGGA